MTMLPGHPRLRNGRPVRRSRLAVAVGLALLVSIGATPMGSLAVTPTEVSYVAVLDGPSEAPPNASPGTGTAQVDFDPVAHTLRVQVTFSGLLGTTTAAHVHTPTAVAGTGTAGVATQTPTFVGFPLGVTAGSYDQTFDTLQLSTWNPAFVTASGGTAASAEAAFESGLAAGKAYMNVHTTAFPSGEIRGFLVPAANFTALSPVHAWIGLRNSDDIGTQFDLRTELLRNDVVVATGLQRCITGVTRNPSLAREAIVSWDDFVPVALTTGDVLSLRVSTRIGTNPDGTRCAGPGGSHNNATGLRLYYDSTSRPPRFDWIIAPAASTDLYLHSDGNACANAPSTGVTTRIFNATAPIATAAKCKDSASVNFANGNVYREIGTWNMTLL